MASNLNNHISLDGLKIPKKYSEKCKPTMIKKIVLNVE